MTATPGSPPGARWWGRIDTLWLIAAPLCALLYTLCLPLAPNDLWYQVRAGWYIVSHGSIPVTNQFSWGVPTDTPYHYQSWIAEILLYQAVAAGLAWAALLRSFCFAAAVGLITATGYRRALRSGASPALASRCAFLGALVAFLIASNNVDLRPQTFSLVLFSLWVFLLGEWLAAGPRTQTGLAVALVGLMLFWVNTHGAFPTGFIYLAVIAAGEFFVRRSWKLLLVTGLCLLAICCNPRGLGIFYYLSLLTNLPINRQSIQEWQSPRFDEWHNILFLLSPLPLLLLAIRNRRRCWTVISPGEWAAALLLFGLGQQSMRAMVWFALWLGPALAVLVANLQAGKPAPEPVIPRGVQVVNAFLLGMLVLLPLPLLPWLKPALPWPPEFVARFAPTPRLGPNGFPYDPSLLLENETPVQAVEFLKRSPARGHIWCDMVYGSYLTWALYPEQKPLCDPRVELFPREFWLRYLHTGTGPPEVTQKLAALKVSDVLLDAEQQPGLMRRLSQDRTWDLILRSGKSRLFRRKNFPQNSSVAKALLH